MPEMNLDEKVKVMQADIINLEGVVKYQNRLIQDLRHDLTVTTESLGAAIKAVSDVQGLF